MPPKIRSRTVAAGGLLGLWLVFVAAVPEQVEPEFLKCQNLSGTPGGNLVVSINSEPRTFNRLLAFDVTTAMIPDRLSSDLVHINRATQELEPSLAASWDTKDGKTYTLRLRRGLQFSDGTPFSIDDVLFSLQIIQNPNIQSAFTDIFAVDRTFPKLSKVDDHTLRISFHRAVGTGLRGLDSLSILPRHRLQNAFNEGKLASAWGPASPPGEIVGLGPFRLKEYQPGIKVVLERNPYYWKRDKSGHRLPYLDTLTFLIIPDRNAEALKFKAGEIDLISVSLDPENFATLKRTEAKGGYRLRDLGPGLDLDFLWFNLNPGKSKAGRPNIDPAKRALFEQAKFRRAISHALDRQGMARSILFGLGVPHYGPIGPGNKTWNHAALPPTNYDPARARTMLLEIGLKDSDGDGTLELNDKRPLEISLLTSRGNMRRERMAQVIKDNLSKIGIRLATQSLDQRDLVNRLINSFEYEAMLFGFAPTDTEPDSQADLWYSSGSNHFWYPNQPVPATPWEREIDTLTSKLLSTLDPNARRGLFFQMQEIWNREMPAVPTISQNVLVGWKSRVGNVRPSILRPHLIWNAEELTIVRH